MRVNRSTNYALLAVGYFARHPDEKIVLSKTIAKEYDIPLEYLHKIMQQLVRINILRSKRGPNGGYSLARPLSKITMLDLIEAAEGPMDVSLGLTETAPRNKFARKTEQAYDKVISQTKAAFGSVNISGLN